MNKKSFTKRILAVALSLIMVLGLMPMTASAITYYAYDVSYRTQSGNNQAWIRYGITDSSAGNFTILDEGRRVKFTVNLKDGWYLEKWDTWFRGGYDKAGWTDPSYDESNPVIDNCNTFYNIAQDRPAVNDSYIRVDHLNVLYGDFRIAAVVRPILTVKAGDGINYSISTANPLTTNLPSNQKAVVYGNNATVSYSVDEEYIVTSVSANYGTAYSENGAVVTVSSIVKPATIDIQSRLKQQKVCFDANGGEGAMSTQVFEHSVEQALTANSFTKTGYIFAGWNAKADGTDTAYTDKQSVTFKPANDGDSITLYAQWTQCTDHNWENGVCTKCGAVCSHSGGTATCTEKATCSVCGMKYGELAKHNIVYSSSDNRIVETCTAGCGHTATADIVCDENVSTVYSGSAIEALKVSYSDNWQGGDLVITYSNNINVGIAKGSVTIGGKTASETFAITEATMSGVSARGYSGVYDGQAHGITVNAPAGATVSYKVGNGTYNTEAPTFKDAETYTVSYKVSMANYFDVEGTAEVKIDKAPLTVTANDKTIIYGDTPANSSVSYSGFVANENADVLGGTLGYDYSYTQYGDVGSYDILPKGLTSNNYEITFVKGTLTVLQKEIGIAWSNTALTYTGEAQKPTATATGTVNGDQLVLTVDGAEANASDTAYTAIVTGISGEKAENYELPSNVSTSFTIGKADQSAPAVGKADETISKKGDGKITGVTAAMEYRKDGEYTYTAITGSTVENLAAGKYYVRVKGDSNHNPSPDTEVAIAAGRKLTVTVPQNQIGYTLTVDTTQIDYMDSPTITLIIAEGYSKTENFAVKLNGKDMQWGDFTQVCTQGCTEDIVITVDGIADITAPNAEISIKNNEWASFWNGITFGHFFNETQDVTITAIDDGSEVNTIQYYLASGELSQSEVEQITDWEDYNGTFKIDPNNRYVVYAKVTDNAGNTLYINSDGIILDNIAPTLEGIENGKTYYGDLTVIKSDEQFYDIKAVTLDGEEMGFAEGTYGLIPADNAEHIVVVEDHAGNKTTYTVIVYKNFTVTFIADGNTLDTQTVGYGKDATVPVVPSKDGYTGKWDHDGKNIIENTTISVMYTALPVVDSDEVKPEDKTNLEDTKAKLEELLDDSYTEDEKKKIQDAIDNIDEALEVIDNVEAVEELIDKLPENITKNDEDAIKAADDAYNALSDYEKSLVGEDAKTALDDAKAALAALNKPADTTSPNTGDNSNLWLWVALLFVSGGTLLSLTVYSRKRRVI